MNLVTSSKSRCVGLASVRALEPDPAKPAARKYDDNFATDALVNARSPTGRGSITFRCDPTFRADTLACSRDDDRRDHRLVEKPPVTGVHAPATLDVARRGVIAVPRPPRLMLSLRRIVLAMRRRLVPTAAGFEQQRGFEIDGAQDLPVVDTLLTSTMLGRIALVAASFGVAADLDCQSECRPVPLSRTVLARMEPAVVAKAKQYVVRGPDDEPAVGGSSLDAAWALPAESVAAIEAAHALLVVATATKCGVKSDGCFTWQLSCPQHARWVGFQLAAVAESARRYDQLRDQAYCRGHFVDLDYDGWSEGNETLVHTKKPVKTNSMQVDTPGSTLLKINHALNRIRYHQPESRLLSFRVPVKYLGTTWYSALFGDVFDGTCLAEVEASCGTRVDGRPPVATIDPCAREGAPTASGPTVAAAGFWLPVEQARREKLEMSDARVLWSSPLTCSTVASFRLEYERMRTLVPIAPFFTPDPQTVHHVVVHTRAGRGSRSPPESAYLPLLDALYEAIEAMGRQCRVVVVTEGANGTLPLFENLARSRPTEFVVKYDANRYAMWHSLWRADVVVSGFSTYSLLAGVLSPHPKLVVAGLDVITGGYLGQLGPCPGVVRSFPLEWTPCVTKNMKLTSKPLFHDLHYPPCDGSTNRNLRYFLGSMVVSRTFKAESAHRTAPTYSVYKDKFPFNDHDAANCTYSVGLNVTLLRHALGAPRHHPGCASGHCHHGHHKRIH